MPGSPAPRPNVRKHDFITRSAAGNAFFEQRPDDCRAAQTVQNVPDGNIVISVRIDQVEFGVVRLQGADIGIHFFGKGGIVHA